MEINIKEEVHVEAFKDDTSKKEYLKQRLLKLEEDSETINEDTLVVFSIDSKDYVNSFKIAVKGLKDTFKKLEDWDKVLDENLMFINTKDQITSVAIRAAERQ